MQMQSIAPSNRDYLITPFSCVPEETDIVKGLRMDANTNLSVFQCVGHVDPACRSTVPRTNASDQSPL